MRKTVLTIIHFIFDWLVHESSAGIVTGSQNASVVTKLLWQDYEIKNIDPAVLNSLYVYDDSEDMVFGKPILWHKRLMEIYPGSQSATAVSSLESSNNSLGGECFMCPEPPKYRTFDGSCNNCYRPRFGKAHTPLVRLLKPTFYNGIDSMPRSITGYPLPLVRRLSTDLFKRRNKRSRYYTTALTVWGQILAHDFARVSMRINDEYRNIKCCSKDGRYPLTGDKRDSSCVFILIPKDDFFYFDYGQRCMDFVRSLAMVKGSEIRLPIQHPNGVSSFLDLSPVYGADNDTANGLRTFIAGMLKTEDRFGRTVMPITQNQSAFCNIDSTNNVCFRSGDYRVNQNPHLVILHTLFVREHNRIAGILHHLNSHWDDERVFQEARRIVIAEYQHITYHEWLPLVIGTSYWRKYGLDTSLEFSMPYNAEVNPGTMSSFTSSVFRFLHCMIPGEMKMYTPHRWVSDRLNLNDYFFKPGIIEINENFEDLIRGLVMQRARQVDARFDEEVTEYLFRGGKDYGRDLVATDIKRSRDHGVPGYNAHRELCGFGRAADFDDLDDDIRGSRIRKLKKLYEHVDDIDLYVGVALEKSIDDGLLGPTAQCIIAEQFIRSRIGDKYFFDNLQSPYPFTREQLKEIKKTTFARILCEAGEQEEMQEYAFKKKSFHKNPLQDCREYPKLNMDVWKDHENMHEPKEPQEPLDKDLSSSSRYFLSGKNQKIKSRISKNEEH